MKQHAVWSPTAEVRGAKRAPVFHYVGQQPSHQMGQAAGLPVWSCGAASSGLLPFTPATLISHFPFARLITKKQGAGARSHRQLPSVMELTGLKGRLNVIPVPPVT